MVVGDSGGVRIAVVHEARRRTVQARRVGSVSVVVTDKRLIAGIAEHVGVVGGTETAVFRPQLLMM